MNKFVFFLFSSLLLVCALAGCSAVSHAVGQPEAAQATAASSLNEKMAAGTLSLEGTDQAVTSEQAAALLPLWKALKNIGSSNSASQAEVEALYAQIAETMTSAQVQAIASLSQENVAAVTQKYSFQNSPGTSATSSSGTSPAATSNGASQAGMPADGGMPPDGEMPSGGGMASVEGMSGGMPSAQTTPQVGQVSTGLQKDLSSVLMEPVIALLERRAKA